MSRRRPRRSSGRLVEPGSPATAVPGIPAWVGQAFGVVLILGDFFLLRPLVDSFDAFSGPGLSGITDPFAGMMGVGVVGWWIVLVGLRRTWAADPEHPMPMSAGAGLTALTMAFVTAVGVLALLAEAVPALALQREGVANPLGIGLLTALMLALAGWQWWLLGHGAPLPEGAPGLDGEPPKGDGKDPSVPIARDSGVEHPGGPSGGPTTPAAGEGQPGPGAGARQPVARSAGPGLRLTAALLLLPAGWALMAPGDLLARRAQEGIARNYPGTLEALGAAALVSIFSAGVGMLLAHGPRALASRVLGEGTSGPKFFLGLWASHVIYLAFSIFGG